MKGTSKILAALLGMVLPSSMVCGQSPQTSNTLTLVESAARPKATLADLKLLVGHWKGEFLGATAEEVWLPTAGGSMLGTFRLYREKEIVFYEIMIAFEEEGSVSIKLKHFHPDLKGWEEKNEMVTFRFIKKSENAIWFEGLTFRKLKDGSLQGFIAIRHKDGSVKEESFRYRPVRAW